MNRSTPALMVLGTGSHVGKSILTAALGRILCDEGYRVAPFKAQNMSLNSAATPDGREIGRAQALQAEACRIPACAEMNPVLIKPSSDTGSQIVVLGKVWGQVTAADYHLHRVEELFPTVIASYEKLAAEYEVIVMEGAGSPAEINLREHDIVNMRMAQAANAACLLVGDIDRGGVFASLLGTMQLLEPLERSLIRGYAINKFRGDVTLLEPGIRMMEPRLGIPCAGVVHFIHDLGLDEEDGVAIEDRRTAARVWQGAGGNFGSARPLRIGVIALPHLSNFTDFDPLAAEPGVSLAYVERPEELQHADLAILPGSKQTMDDLVWLRQRGFDRAVSQMHSQGRILMGICGGFQMLGTRIDDPHGIERAIPSACGGLGLLPIRSVLNSTKTTRQVQGVCQSALFGQPFLGQEFHGYEIHVGETVYDAGSTRFSEITREGLNGATPDGAVSIDGRVLGTYVHGFFDGDSLRHAFVDAARKACGLAPSSDHAFVAKEREARLDRLADHVRRSLDLDLIRSWIGLTQRTQATR